MIASRALNTFNVGNMRALQVKNESLLTAIQILTNVGSSAEQPEMYGMAHILEHMFFKGSAKRPGGTSISRAANDIGGKLNAYTTYDHTVYYITVLNEKFEEGLDILADMYQNPLFPAEEFAKELNPILSEYREREDDPDNFIMERALAQYMGRDYHPIIGTESTIRAATVERMHAFKQEYYGGNNCLVSVVGGVDEARVRRALENAFGASKETRAPELRPATYARGELELTKPGIQEAYYYRFFPGLPTRHPDRYKQDLMCYVLGGNDSGFLFERIREELGMSCYYIYSWLMRYEPFSLLGISCGISQNELDQVDREIQDQIDRICDDLISEEQLNRARASLHTSLAAKSETSAGLSSLVSLPVLKGETENPIEKDLRGIMEVTREDIRDIARETFAGEQFRGILTPKRA